jgi:ParB family chromosome partitioning protein
MPVIIGLLDKVDERQLAFNPAVELSYLSQKEQMTVAAAMEANEIKPSLSQAVSLKKMKQAGGTDL